MIRGQASWVVCASLLCLVAGCAGGTVGRQVTEPDSGKRPGTEGARCFPNKTCYSGLACLSNTCVRLPDGWVQPSDSGIWPQGSIGSLCTPAKACQPGLSCVVIDTKSQRGFCTKSCTNPGQPCQGAPAGTLAYCGAKDSTGKYLCIFACRLNQGGKVQTYPCPGGLKCMDQGKDYSICL